MKEVLYCRSLEDLPEMASAIIALCQNESIWLFEGEMGAGKTTLIKAICMELGVLNTVQSPTFSIVNEYLTGEGESVFHFDCYRLKNETEALDFGIEEYLDSGNYCFIEWPSKIKNLIPTEHVVVEITEVENRERRLEIRSRK